MRSWFPRIALLVLSSAFCLFVAEAGTRILALQAAGERLEELDELSPARGERVGLKHIIVPATDPRVIYRLRPGLDVVFRGVRTTTNAEGFRGERAPLAKPADERRIVGLGDSFMFGWGVGDGEGYLEQTALELSERTRERWRAINTAAPGYNTAMELAIFEASGLAYEPDVVVVGLVANDTDLPNFILEAPDVTRLDRSFLWSFASQRLGRPVDLDPFAPPTLVSAPRASEQRFVGDADRTPTRYRDMVGSAAIEASFDRLGSLAQVHGFDVVVVHVSPARWPGLEPALAHARTLDFWTIDLGKHFEALLEREGDVTWRHSKYALSEDDPHPSALAHAISGRLIANQIERISQLPAVASGAGAD